MGGRKVSTLTAPGRSEENGGWTSCVGTRGSSLGGVRLGGWGSLVSEGGACSTLGPLHTSGLAWAPLRCLATPDSTWGSLRKAVGLGMRDPGSSPGPTRQAHEAQMLSMSLCTGRDPWLLFDSKDPYEDVLSILLPFLPFCTYSVQSSDRGRTSAHPARASGEATGVGSRYSVSESRS